MTDKAALLAAIAPREETVDVAGHKVLVRELSNAAHSEKLLDPGVAFYAAMTLCCFDPDSGKPLFTEDDIPLLQSRARRGLKALAEAVMRVNGMDAVAEQKNSEAGPAAG